MNIIRVENLEKIYKNNVCALKNVNFQVEAGQFVSFIGISGAGKTSLMRILNGSLLPTKGDVFFQEQSLFHSGKKEKRNLQKRIGTIYQDFCLVDGLTCYENVLNGCLAERTLFETMAGSFTKEQREYAKFALKEVGLGEKCDVRARDLSGGQKQRTAIARAIMQKPQLLLADEPVASLDPYTAEQILELLKRLQEEHHLTVMMNSHNVEASLKYSHRIIGIRQEIVMDKETAAVCKDDLACVYGDGDGK